MCRSKEWYEMAGKPAQQLGGGEGWEHLNAPAHWLRTALSAMAGGDDDTVRLTGDEGSVLPHRAAPACGPVLGSVVVPVQVE